VRVRPAWGAVLGLALVGLVVAAVIGVRAWGAAASAVPTPVTPTVPTGVAGSGGSSGSSGAKGPSGAGAAGASSGSRAGPDGTAPASVTVHVVGQVKTPGVVRLSAGSRVEDAVRAAGGGGPAAQLSGVNLARVLADGEQIVVPAVGDPPVAGAAASGGGAAGPANGAGRGAGGRIDLNTADLSVLDTLPGVGPVTAQKIVDWRRANGRFTSVDELAEVPGIGPKLMEQLRPLVVV